MSVNEIKILRPIHLFSNASHVVVVTYGTVQNHAINSKTEN